MLHVLLSKRHTQPEKSGATQFHSSNREAVAMLSLNLAIHEYFDKSKIVLHLFSVAFSPSVLGIMILSIPVPGCFLFVMSTLGCPLD